MPVWSHLRVDDPGWCAHQMTDDRFGRPTEPVCGRSSEGLRFLRDLEWACVPGDHRCARCGRRR